MTGTMNFDADALKRLDVAYTQAVNDGKEVFSFDGHELFVPYAKYLIEYLEKVL